MPDLPSTPLPLERQPQGSESDLGANDEPDVRLACANERMFLAWNRTALALIATGAAATQLLPTFDMTWGRRLLGVPLVALGAIASHLRSSRSLLPKPAPDEMSPLPDALVLYEELAALGEPWKERSTVRTTRTSWGDRAIRCSR
jgi:putative membrane protein